MSKLIKALEVIQDECAKHVMCYTCPLRYKEDGGYTCRLDYWGVTQALQPREWPIYGVRKVEHEK